MNSYIMVEIVECIVPYGIQLIYLNVKCSIQLIHQDVEYGIVAAQNTTTTFSASCLQSRAMEPSAASILTEQTEINHFLFLSQS